MKKPLIFKNREDHNDLRNTFVDNKHEHSLGDYLMKNETTVNKTSSNITVKAEMKNMSKIGNKTSEKVEYPTTAREVQKRMENIDH